MYDRPQRGFSRAPEISQRNIRATVKWYNETKGFGFVTPEDGSPDAFLHVSALQSAGYDSLPEGATIVCDLAQGGKGPQVAAIYSVDSSTAAPSRGPRSGGFGDRDGGFGGQRGGFRQDRGPRGGFGDRDSGPTTDAEGTVKWFNATKGFGFITPADGGKDIFVHANVLSRSGLHDLAEGAQVRMSVRQGQKGPEAVSVEII
ncbi:MAG TPA: cold shock domain-containing protein [Alphaproteobacteria bacterium]|nr:cold shock domain-containing protein [Alphaproteobacteria bacterium]